MEETAAIAALKISAEIGKDVLFEIAKLLSKGMYNLAAISLAATKTAMENRSGNRGIISLLKGHTPIATAIKRGDYNDFLALCKQYKVPFANVDNPITAQVEIVIREADLPIFTRIFQRLGMGEFQRVSDVDGRGTLQFDGATGTQGLDMRDMFEKAGLGELYDEYAAYIIECEKAEVHDVPEDPTIAAENELTSEQHSNSRQTEPNPPTPQERQVQTQSSQEPRLTTPDPERIAELLNESGLSLPSVAVSDNAPLVGTVYTYDKDKKMTSKMFFDKPQMLSYARTQAKQGFVVDAAVYSRNDTAFINALSGPLQIGKLSYRDKEITQTMEFANPDDMVRFAKEYAKTVDTLDAIVYLSREGRPNDELINTLSDIGADVIISNEERPADYRITVTIEEPPKRGGDTPLHQIEDIGDRLNAAQALADAKNAVNVPTIPAPQLEK
jgi:hypothetical protein